MHLTETSSRKSTLKNTKKFYSLLTIKMETKIFEIN
nr:MAG TPA: hypothetical protein [Caudoviricetes sp.]